MTIVKSVVFILSCAGVTSINALPAKIRQRVAQPASHPSAAEPASSQDTTMARMDGPSPVPSMFAPRAPPRPTILRERKASRQSARHPAPPAKVYAALPTSSGDSTMARMDGPPPVPSMFSPEAPRTTIMRERRPGHNSQDTAHQLQRDDFAEGLSGEPARYHPHDGFKTPSPKSPSTPPVSGVSSERGSPVHVGHTAQSLHHNELPTSPRPDMMRAGKRPVQPSQHRFASTSGPSKKQRQTSTVPGIYVPQPRNEHHFKVIDAKTSTHFQNVDDYLKHLAEEHKTTKDPRWIEEHQKLIPRPQHDKPGYKNWGSHDWESQEHEQDEETLRHRNNWEAKNKAMQHMDSVYHGVVRDPLGRLMVHRHLTPEEAHERNNAGKAPKLIVKYPSGDQLKPVLHFEQSDDHLALKEEMEKYFAQHKARDAAKAAALETKRAAQALEPSSSSGVEPDPGSAATSKPASPSRNHHEQQGHHHQHPATS